MKKIVPCICVLAYSIIAFLAIVPSRGGYVSIGYFDGLILSSLLYFIAFYILTLLVLCKYKNKLPAYVIIATLLTGAVIFENILTLVAMGSDSLSDLHPLYSVDLGCRLGGILLGYTCFAIKSKKNKIIFSVLMFALLLTMLLFLPNKILNKASFGSYSGKINEVVETDVIFTDGTENEVDIKQIESDFVVLDFWTSSCGSCFKAFPKVQQLYDEYKDNSSVEIFAVFCPQKNDLESKGTGILEKRGYTFPCLSTIKGDSTREEVLKVKVFPTVLIFDKTRTLIFRGNIEDARGYLLKVQKNVN